MCHVGWWWLWFHPTDKLHFSVFNIFKKLFHNGKRFLSSLYPNISNDLGQLAFVIHLSGREEDTWIGQSNQNITLLLRVGLWIIENWKHLWRDWYIASSTEKVMRRKVVIVYHIAGRLRETSQANFFPLAMAQKQNEVLGLRTHLKLIVMTALRGCL